MAEPTMQELAERLAALEKQMARLTAAQEVKGWRDTVGMFDDDPAFMRQVIAEGEAIRDSERHAVLEEIEADDCLFQGPAEPA